MALSFRQIGSRMKLQGGGSGSNIFIGNKLVSAQPIIISGNDKLIESIVNNINTRVDLINTLLLPVETLVKAQPLDILYLVSLINPAVIVLLLDNANSFISGIFTTYTSLFYTTIKAKFQTAGVLLSLALRLTPYASAIVAAYPFLSSYIITSFTQELTNNKAKLQLFSERFVPFLFEYDYAIIWFINRYTLILSNSSGPILNSIVNFNILPNMCTSSTYVSLCPILVPNDSTSTIVLSSTVFTNSVLANFTSVIFNLQDAKLNVVKTLFTSAGGVSVITVSFNSTITNPSDSPWVIYLCAKFVMPSGYVTATGVISVLNAPL